MNRHVNSISGRLSLRPPQRRSLEILDRIHAAMLLQACGRTNAPRALLKVEQERGPDFLSPTPPPRSIR